MNSKANVNSVNRVNHVNSVNSVTVSTMSAVYSEVLPPSQMLFFPIISVLRWGWNEAVIFVSIKLSGVQQASQFRQTPSIRGR